MLRTFQWSLTVLLCLVPIAAWAQDGAPAASAEAAAETPAQTETLATIPVDAPPAEDAAAPEETGSRSRLTEEIVVTAQKREENILDVPISISAFSGEALDAKGIGDPKTLAQSIPGVTYGETVNFSIIYVRGVGTDAFLPDSDLSVAMYLDGIYFPFANGLSQSLGAIERVEVLKGPQGTLFGRNSTGGAFNITSRSPDLEEPEVSVSTGYSEFDTFSTRVYGNVPLHDTLALNASLVYTKGDNYYDGTRADEPLPKEVEKGARLRVLWQPSEWLDLALTGIKHRKDGLASSAMPNIRPSTATAALYRLTQGREYEVPDQYDVFIDVPSFFALDNDVAYAQLGLHPAWFDIKLLGSHQDVSTDNNYDFDGTEAPFITFDARGQFAKVKTVELQFISNQESGPDWLEWVAGFYYIEQEVGFPRNRLTGGSLDLSDDALASLQLPPGVNDFFVGISDTIEGLLGVPLPDGGSVALVSLQDADAEAYFGQATVHFTDWVYLTLGGRFQDETRKVVTSGLGLANADGSLTGPLYTLGTPEKDDTNFAPKVVLGFKPADDALIYGSWSRGFKSGTFNTVNIYDTPEYVLPEEVDSYELGTKITFAGGQMQFNSAAFRNEIKNQQVQFISLLAGGAVRLENAAEVEINGGELELNYTPDWNTGLFLGGSVTYLDATYGSYPNASAYSEPFGLYNFGQGDFSGNRTVRTPEWAGNLTLNQAIDLGNGVLEFGATGFYSSHIYFQPSNVEHSKQEAYFTLDGQISYLHNASQLRISLLGKNLTDENYQLTQFHTDSGVQHVLAPPRAFGVRVDVTFK